MPFKLFVDWRGDVRDLEQSEDVEVGRLAVQAAAGRWNVRLPLASRIRLQDGVLACFRSAPSMALEVIRGFVKADHWISTVTNRNWCSTFAYPRRHEDLGTEQRQNPVSCCCFRHVLYDMLSKCTILLYPTGRQCLYR